MSLRWQFGLYLFGIHALFASVAAYVWWGHAWWLAGVEFFLLMSLLIAIKLMRRMLKPLQMMHTGADLIAEGDFASRFSPVGQPEVDRLVTVYNEMADQLREERVRSEEQHYFLNKVLQESPLGIVTLNYDQQIEMVNPSAERMLQRRASDLMGKRLGDLGIGLGKALEDLLVGESRVVPFTGQRRIKCQKARFIDRGFERQFILLEELTEELRQSEKRAYEHLIRMMSHEVNNTVGAVNSLLQSCLNYSQQIRNDDREDFENALRVAVDRTGHLNVFMKGFADVVRLPDPDKRSCDVKDLLADIEVLMTPTLEARHIRWVWDEKVHIGVINADKNQLEQVFVNVLKNAMEAIDQNGTITVVMGLDQGRSFVAIEDTGSGVSVDAKDQLFAPFFSTKRDGQGIGLTLVQEILNRHGFDFALESKSDKPTRFTIWF